MADLFGFSITRKKSRRIQNKALLHHKRMTEHKPSPLVVILVQYLDMEGTAKNEQNLLEDIERLPYTPNVIWQLKILSMRLSLPMN